MKCSSDKRFSLKNKQNPIRKGLLSYYGARTWHKGIEEPLKGFRKITLVVFWSMILWVMELEVGKPVRKFG